MRLEANLPASLLPIWRERMTADPATLRSWTAGAIFVQPISPHAVSATTIRERLSHGNAAGADKSNKWDGLLPPAVLAYIDHHHLYRQQPDAP
jgi:nicotinic acid mononucleotide adenylyltransferase